ncbi:MAG: S8 family serine peptidase [Nitrosopumilus sp.]
MQHTKLFSFMLIFTLAATLSITPALIPAQASPSHIPDRYIVILNDDSNPWSVANEMAEERGLAVSHVYGNAVNGFSAIVPRGQLDNVASDPRVNYIEQDSVVSIYKKPNDKPGNGGNDATEDSLPPQTIPTGISLIHATTTGTVDVNVAVIDTGIDENHPDLNVVDGVNFVFRGKNTFDDGHGHGTHVAGTIGAIDNAQGVIGVAPGANLYSVRVLDNSGSGTYSGVIAGIDWVAANAETIDVANMSLGGGASQAINQAVESAVAAGVVFVVAAGNENTDACTKSPASAPSAITVSALDDRNGILGSNDSFASFSNSGSCVDMIAPGVLIESTWKGGGYNTISGTSMASPHVAGAAALYIANDSNLTPAQVTQALINDGIYSWNNSADDDDTQEPLLDLS